MESRTLAKNVHVATLVAIVLAVVLKTAKCEECYHIVNSSIVTSPDYPQNYPDDYQCSWKFETTPGCTVKLVFDSIELEQHQDCQLDYVELYDGETVNDSFLGRLCGDRIPEKLYHFSSTTNKMLMIFRTDKSVTRKGFQLTYMTECYRFLSPSKEEVLTSPNYPNAYPHLYFRVWKFETNPGYIIKLVFNSLALEWQIDDNNALVCLDYVALYDGYTMNDDILLGDFCENELHPPIISTAQKMLVAFQTDASVSDLGFRATLKSEFDFNAVITDETKRNLTQYFLNTRQHSLTINKWGKDITRTAVALFLDDPQFFAAGNKTGEEIAYELTLQLMAKLVLKKRISAKDLALFINAMTVACIDPTNFFGVNIVAELRNRVDNSNDTNPFFILALCNGGDNMKMEDVHKLQQLFDAHLLPSWTDTQAMVVMALKCISGQSQRNLNSTLSEMVSELIKKQQTNGTIDNLKNTALVIQALIATDSVQTNFNLNMAFKSILKEMEQTHVRMDEMYYILPIFKWKTLLDINSNHCDNTIKTDLSEMIKLRENPDERILVQISIIIGDDMDFSRTWSIKVPPNYSFYQVLENISSSEPDYKIRYVVSEGKPYIADLANFQHSTEDGSFWFIFTKPLSSIDDPVLVKESPADIQMNYTNELILWYRSRPSSQEVPSNVTDTPSEIFNTTRTNV